MKEKKQQLLKALGLEVTDHNMDIIGEWVTRTSRLVSGFFTMDPLLFGDEKKKTFAFNYTKTCLEIGRLAINSCGEMVKEEANLERKLDVYKPHILVWDLSNKDNLGPMPNGEIQ